MATAGAPAKVLALQFVFTSPSLHQPVGDSSADSIKVDASLPLVYSVYLFE